MPDYYEINELQYLIEELMEMGFDHEEATQYARDILEHEHDEGYY